MTDKKQFTQFKQSYTYKNDVYITHNIDQANLKTNIVHNSGNYVIFCLCHKGTAKIQVNSGTRILQPGTHIIFIPSTYISLIEASNDFDSSFIAFSPEFRQENRYTHSMPLIDALLFLKEMPPMQLGELQQDFFIKMRDIFIQTIKTMGPSYINPLLKELACSFFIWEEGTVATNININPTNKNPRDLMVARFMTLVSENFRQEHKLEFYAKQLSITPKYLSAVIKNVTERTASQWIDAFLISEAQNLLSTTSKNVAEISDILGFPNQSFFGKYFKHHVGKGPLAYRYKSPEKE